MKLVKDKNQLDLFIDFLPSLINDEVYFFSLSARNKYLTEDERQFYSLGKTEMFSRTTCSSKEYVEYSLDKMFSSLYHKRTRNGEHIPRKALVTYANINPSSTIKAFTSFKADMDRKMMEIWSAQQKGLNPEFIPFHTIEKRLLSEIQKTQSRRVLLDIDFDVPNDKLVTDFSLWLDDRDIKYRIIKTRSGYHVIIVKETLDKKNNLHDKILSLHNEAKSDSVAFEVKINKNNMVPIPGTMQSQHLVTFLS